MANHDRIADLYHRRIHSPEAQNACRDRIHWLCERAVGEHVLDLGCSQGVVSIILAREGRTVTAIDIEEVAIEAAREALTEESEEIRGRVTLQVADAFTVEFAPDSFDVVILGEVLEHLAAPSKLLARVGAWLRPGGRVVVSVPHGYEPFHDHKRAFYLQRFVNLVADQFELSELEPVAGRYLCAVLTKPAKGPARPPTAEQILTWTNQCEDALEQIQRRSHDERSAILDEKTALARHVSEYRDTIADLKKSNSELSSKAEQIETERNEAQQLVQHTRSILSAELNDTRRQWEDAVRNERALAKRFAEHQLATSQQLEQAKQAAAAEKSLREEAERSCAQLRARADELENARDAEVELRKQRQHQLGIVTEERRTLEQQRANEKGDETQKRRRAEALVERLRNQLEYNKSELELTRQGVRYRLGDAFVLAARPSLDTLKLPVRIFKLFSDGLRRRGERKREAKQRRAQTAAPAPQSKDVKAPPASAQAKGSPPKSPSTPAPTELDQVCTLAQPYSSAPPELRRRNDIRIGAVTDEFSWRAWQYEADLYTFTPQTWREVLEERPPNLLLVESAWSGLDDSWYFQIRDLCKRGEVIKYYAIPEIIDWCRQRQIPTVFYNKEDPPNFDVFVDAAKRFDFVFTSDANCIPDYRKHVGHDRVFALPFAAQPRIHNPIMTGGRTGSVCFAGTWYAHRHFARHDDATKILRPALDYDLHIFDRMAASKNENYRWPDEFLGAVRGALPYAQMLAAYKRYKVFMNINSVKNSPTMFSRRVFELLACGTPVISSYSEGIEELLGADVVLMSDDEATTRQHLERVLGDDDYRERLALSGQRKVFTEHTYTNRLSSVLQAAGLKAPEVGRPAMTMIAAISADGDLAAALDAYRRQDYENKRLIVCATNPAACRRADALIGDDAGIRVVVCEGALWGQALQDVAKTCGEGYAVALNPRHCYGPHYLTDYANATLYVTEPAIGKASHFSAQDDSPAQVAKPGSEYHVVATLNPWTLCLSRDRLREAAAALGSAQTPDEWWSRVARGFDRVYSSDRFNYVQRDSQTVGDRAATPPGGPSGNGVPRELECALA